jgi:hypothetical protein
MKNTVYAYSIIQELKKTSLILLLLRNVATLDVMGSELVLFVGWEVGFGMTENFTIIDPPLATFGRTLVLNEDIGALRLINRK